MILSLPSLRRNPGRKPDHHGGNFAAIGLRRDAPGFAIWLAILCALIAATLVLGGITRLTDSGLSITEWRPISGALPPLSAEDWQREFSKYQQIPQFAIVNPDMTLGEFRQIWFWEWTHRNLARALGLVFLLPFLVFWMRGAFNLRLWTTLFVLLLFGGMQGLVGWWMVQSGLTSDRVHVVPWRLMVHLLIPVALLGVLFAVLLTGLSASVNQVKSDPGKARPLSLMAYGLCGLTFLQMMLGALTAGNRAGRIYTDWPLMGGALVPESYADLTPFWHNLIENPAAVQFNHRILAYLLLAAAWLAFALQAKKARTGAWRHPFFLFAVLVTAQAALGIVTLIGASPIGLALAHQILGVVTWLGAITLLCRTSAVLPVRRTDDRDSSQEYLR